MRGGLFGVSQAAHIVTVDNQTTAHPSSAVLFADAAGICRYTRFVGLYSGGNDRVNACERPEIRPIGNCQCDGGHHAIDRHRNRTSDVMKESARIVSVLI